MSGANYNGRQPNNTAYIKTFVEGALVSNNLWKYFNYFGKNVLTPSNASSNLYIPGDIIVGGKIIYENTNTSENEITQLKFEIMNLKNEMKQLKNLLSGNIND